MANITDKEIEFIKNNYTTMSPREIGKELGRGESTIYVRMKRMGLAERRANGELWTDEEIAYLKENYLNMSFKNIGIKLGRLKGSISGKLLQLGLKKYQKNANWTEEEKNVLIDNINSKTYKEMSKLVFRTINSIRRKAGELGLIQKDVPIGTKLKKEQVEFIIANCDKMTDLQLAIKFNVSDQAISDTRKRFGIAKTGRETNGPSYIEDFVRTELQINKIEHIFDEMLEEYRPDFQIIGTNILIEVHGDYWHCNPYIYKDGPKDEVQIKHVLRDYYKRCYYLSRGYEIIYIWERDIVKYPDKIKSTISNCRLNSNITEELR